MQSMRMRLLVTAVAFFVSVLCLSVCLSCVCLSVCLLVTTMSPAKTDEPIKVPFGVMTWLG